MMRETRVAGHFGELLQGRLGPAGPLALVTLPCPALTLTARHLPGRGLAVHGGGQRLLTPARARRFLAAIGAGLHGRVALCAQMPAGGGAGASTAALVALARLSGSAPPPEALAHACLAAEGATDPLMFPAPERLLWASREARVLGRLPPLPRLEVVGGFFGRPRQTDPRDLAFADISDLIGPWRAAALAGDAAAIAGLAATSAARTLALRGPAGDPTAGLAADLCAAGFVIGHTGSARGLLFLPGTVPEGARGALLAAGFRGLVRFRVGGEG